MSAQNTTLHLATTFSCDDNNCSETLTVEHVYPYSIIKPRHFTWNDELNARTTNDKRNVSHLNTHHWKTYLTPSEPIMTRHYCPKHQPPTWARTEQEP